jgi:cytochrome P450
MPGGSWVANAAIDPLFELDIVEDPHDYYARLRDADPVHELPGTGTFLVTRMDLIHEVVARPAVYSSVSSQFLHRRANGDAPGLRGVSADSEVDTSQGSVLATADPPDHTRQRKVVTRRLSTIVMQEMEPEFRDLVDAVLDDALPTGRIEWMRQLAEPLPMVMVARILGLDDSAAPALKEQGYASVEAISGFVTDERFAELGAPMMNVGPVVDAYFAMRETQQYDPNTLIGVCLRAVDAGELTDIEALATLFLLVSAGGESTTSLTGTGVRILAERRDLQDRLRREPHLIPAFVEEACRMACCQPGPQRVRARRRNRPGPTEPAPTRRLRLGHPPVRRCALGSGGSKGCLRAAARPDRFVLDRPGQRTASTSPEPHGSATRRAPDHRGGRSMRDEIS